MGQERWWTGGAVVPADGRRISPRSVFAKVIDFFAITSVKLLKTMFWLFGGVSEEFCGAYRQGGADTWRQGAYLLPPSLLPSPAPNTRVHAYSGDPSLFCDDNFLGHCVSNHLVITSSCACCQHTIPSSLDPLSLGPLSPSAHYHGTGMFLCHSLRLRSYLRGAEQIWSSKDAGLQQYTQHIFHCIPSSIPDQYRFGPPRNNRTSVDSVWPTLTDPFTPTNTYQSRAATCHQPELVVP